MTRRLRPVQTLQVHFLIFTRREIYAEFVLPLPRTFGEIAHVHGIWGLFLAGLDIPPSKCVVSGKGTSLEIR